MRFAPMPLVHHQTFKADHTYHLIHEEDKETIPMAWWKRSGAYRGGHRPVLVASWFIGHVGRGLRRRAGVRVLFTAPTNTALVHASSEKAQ